MIVVVECPILRLKGDGRHCPTPRANYHMSDKGVIK